MQSYTKTNWVNDETYLNQENMNKIENQLETVTNELITPTHEHSQYLTHHQDISGKEDNANKVTSISSSSTNTQYPSAKCVYEAINNAIGSALGGSY